MDLQKGKEIFFRYYGSSFYIDSECGDEYRKCNVPRDVEKAWSKEIKHNLICRIKITSGAERIKFVNLYIQLLDCTDSVNFLISMLREYRMDTFSSILLAESLKTLAEKCQDTETKNTALSELKSIKIRLKSEKPTVDSSYTEPDYMKDYDFSEEAVLKRIDRL